ncbi:MAG: carboxypeptidase-like regulatory domain-containing protein, partial [bacterium]|nr:carboxypeptidase-like regulatory domain-containing protein [bacterium]
MSKLGKFFLLVVILLSLGSYAYACKPAPFVDITQPVNNFTTDQNTLAVTVVFGPYRCKHKHLYNKTQLIVLKIDNKKVASYYVSKRDKDGSANFTINISSSTEGSHVIKAFAYKDKKGKHQIAKSEPVTFIIKRTPPPPEPPVVTPQSGFIHGQVIDSDTELAVSEARLTIPGVQGVLLTDAAGKFRFPTPGSGQYTILISKEGYITSERTIRVVSTRNTTVDVIYVKRLDPAVTTITNAGGTHSNAAGTLQLTFPPNCLPEGVSSINVQATMYEKDRELLSPLPRTTIFTYAFKVLPDRIKFTQPVIGRFANSLGFAPGTSIPIGYYNPDTHKWEDTGAMSTVSSDGVWVDFQMTHFCAFDHN